jgi:hypothetical protein
VNNYEYNMILQNGIAFKFRDTEIDFAIKKSENSKAIDLDEICFLWLKKSNSKRHYLLK